MFRLNLGGMIVGPESLPAPSQVLATQRRAYWTQFADTGSPNGGGTPAWSTASSAQLQLLVAPRPSVESVADCSSRHKCAFWAG